MTFTYDGDGRLTAIGYADNTSIITAYDQVCRQTSSFSSRLWMRPFIVSAPHGSQSIADREGDE